MRINISALKKDLGASLAVKSELDAAVVDWDEGVKATTPILLEAEVTNSGRCFVVRGTLTGVVEITCNRCLQPFELELRAPFEEEFFPQTTGRKQAEEETPELFAEASTYHGDIIDLTEAIQEYAMLALPYKALCQVDCAGLCAQCGQNLNQGKCGCEQVSLDPRLAGLASLLNEKAEGRD